MFIDRGEKTLLTPFAGAESCRSGEALVEFRSCERSWFWGFCAPAYKHFTPNGVNPHSNLKLET